MKLISVNIENENHLDRVIPFLKKEQPDVLCLQEVFKTDLPTIEHETGLHAIFAPTMNITQDLTYHRMKAKGHIGLAILSATRPVNHGEIIYAMPPGIEGIPTWDGDPRNGDVWRKLILAATYRLHDGEYRVITTHFTWSFKGIATDVQRDHMGKLIGVLDQQSEFILAGDFNAPRGGEIWNRLAARYKDNIPPYVQTTIDNTLHKVSKEKSDHIQLVVDGMFSTAQYKVSNVRVVGGVSDHMAVVAEVTRRF